MEILLSGCIEKAMQVEHMIVNGLRINNESLLKRDRYLSEEIHFRQMPVSFCCSMSRRVFLELI